MKKFNYTSYVLLSVAIIGCITLIIYPTLALYTPTGEGGGSITSSITSGIKPNKHDLQYPDYPSCSEGVAGATLLRLNGVDVKTEEFISKLPTSDSDYIYHFLGDPRSSDGGTILAPGLMSYLNTYLDNTKQAVLMKDADFNSLPVPCLLYVTTSLHRPEFTGEEKDGYKLASNTHVVTLVSKGEDKCGIIDPMVGLIECDRKGLESRYDEMGRQAIYIERMPEGI